MTLERRPGKVRQHLIPQDREHLLVPVEARHGHPAHCIQDRPFPGMRLQIVAILPCVRAGQFMQPALDTFADLSAHPSKPRPAHV